MLGLLIQVSRSGPGDMSLWWRHQTFSALLALCAGNSPVTGDFPLQRSVTRSFDVFFDLRLNKRLSKQSWGWWFETSLWRHYNVIVFVPQCLPCAEGCDTCEDNSPCLYSYKMYIRTPLLILTLVMIGLTVFVSIGVVMFGDRRVSDRQQAGWHLIRWEQNMRDTNLSLT